MRVKDNTCKKCGTVFQVEIRRGTDRSYCSAACKPVRVPKRGEHLCEAPGCGHFARSPKATLCEGHYCRLRRTGKIAPLVYRTPKPEHCQADGCKKPVSSLGLCAMHRARLDRHGDIDKVLKRGVKPGEAWSDQACSYGAAHSRLNGVRGTAHKCERCGAQRRKYQWALKASAQPNASDSTEGPFSMNPNDYEMLCISCHKTMDMGIIRSGVRHSRKTATVDRRRGQ